MAMPNVSAIFAIFAFLSLSAAAADENRDTSGRLDELVSTHESVFAARVIMGKMIFSSAGTPCFYEYAARPFQVLRGNQGTRDFKFFSEAHLEVGGDYLIFFSAQNDKVYKSSAIPVFVDGHKSTGASDCKRRMTGNFLLGGETGLITFLERGGKAVQAVEFEDPVSDVPPSVVSTETVRAIDYDYIASRLK